MNPYFCYCLSFFVALALYPLGWSAFYPPLGLALAIFLLITLAGHALVGVAWRRKLKFDAGSPALSLRAAVGITLFIYVLWTADFMYEGGVPLYKILFNRPYNYRMFGIPSVHVFTVTFASFFTVYLFHQYLQSGRREFIWLVVIHLAAAVLIYSRSMFVFNSIACLLVFIQFRPLSPRFVLSAAAGALALLFLFGVMGNLRVAREAGEPYGAGHFLDTGGATQRFRDSWVPKEYFWIFIYTTSPLANLQTNVNLAPQRPVTAENVFRLLLNELTFDSVSKRVNQATNSERASEVKIDGPFNVSTVYSASFSYLAWAGMACMAVFLLGLPWLYKLLLPSFSPFFLSGMALLATMYLFMAYDNTLRHTGVSFQLVYPVVLNWLVQRGLLSFAGLHRVKS
jgi:hypothetical protein